MPAPRLLDKKILNQELALQKKRDIESGINLAKKVDAVRETLGEEEQRLNNFREQSIRRVQIEIDAEIRKRDYLLEGNKKLQEERIRLSAPIDLSQAWDEVKTGKKDNIVWQERLSIQQIEVLAEKEDLKTLSQALKKQQEETARKDELSERTLNESERKFTQASNTLERAEKESKAMLEHAKEHDNHSKVREEEATIREISLTKREAEVDAHEIDLATREKKLQSRQELFLKAQKYLSTKK